MLLHIHIQRVRGRLYRAQTGPARGMFVSYWRNDSMAPPTQWQLLTERCALCRVVKKLQLKVLKSHTFREPIETFLPQGVTEENQPHLFFSSLRWVCLTHHILQLNCLSRCESQLRIQTWPFFCIKNTTFLSGGGDTKKIKRSQQSHCSWRGKILPISKATLAWENSIFRGEKDGPVC